MCSHCRGKPAGVESTVVGIQKVLCDTHFAVIPLLVLDSTALLLHTQLSFPYAALTSQGLGLVDRNLSNSPRGSVFSLIWHSCSLVDVFRYLILLRLVL